MMTKPTIIPVGGEPMAMHPQAPTPHQAHAARLNEKTTGNRFPVLNAFVDFEIRNLNGSEVAVWLILFRDTKPDGSAKTSVADLARRAGVNVSTVKRATKSLVSKGLLAVVYRGTLSRGPSSYRVNAVPEKIPRKEAAAMPAEECLIGRTDETLLGRI